MKNNYSRLKWVALIILGGMLMFLSMVATAAIPTPLPLLQQEVSGIVEDQNGLPIPGVTITIKNTNRGTVTNLDGQYSITAPSNGVLVFSFIGYSTIEIEIDGQKEIDIKLEEDIAALGEVQINAGYYNTTERERTGSISRVSSEDIEMQPIVSPLEALQGRMAGVEIEQPSGIRGVASSIRIRGRNSLRLGGDQPLFIVDGVPINANSISSIGLFTQNSGMDPLSTLNLSNIESIEVLKDADATAIYGSRGANGVVLISTKRNKGGRSQVEAKIYSGFSQVSNRMDLMNTAEYLEVRRTAFENDGVTPTESNAPDLVLWDQNRETDWQEELLGGTSPITDITMSVSGGNEQTSFRLGGSYRKEGSVFPGTFEYNKATANFSLNHRSKDNKFALDFTANYGVDNNQLFFGSNYVRLAVILPPNAPELYNDDGSLNWAENRWINPLNGLFKPQDIETNNLLSNLSLKYNLGKGLEFKTNFGYSNLISGQVTKNLINSFNPVTWGYTRLSSYHSDTRRKSWIIEPQMTYNKQFGGFNVNAITGLTFQENQNSLLTMDGTGYGDDSLVGNLSAADQVRVNSDQKINYRYAAIFGRLGLDWKKKYYFNITGRKDGSSRFGPNKRIANFGAIGAAWIFSEETFIQQNLSFLSFGKFRGSYGTTGSDQIPDYGFMDTYETTNGPGGLYPTKLYNPNFSWEINKKLEAALQLGFIEDRINLEVNWYRNRSSNQLTGYPLPAITGFSSVQANLPATIENSGWEIALNTLNTKGENFFWQTSLNFTIPRNKLVEFDNLDLTPYRQTYRVGEPLSIALVYKYDGINPDTGRYEVKDINEDGRLDFSDRTGIAFLGRKYYGGIQNTVKVRNFNLGFLFEYINQDKHSYLRDTGRTPGYYGNNSTQILDAWTQAGDHTNIQQLSTSSSSSFLNALESDRMITDASFLRLKTLSLSYQFSKTFVERMGVKELDLYLHAQNLFTLTNYLGLDPQAGLAVPPMRTITSGLRITI
ncbi:SusC/RagA family TonB-linked outer membrane protein [Salegentibacter salinarum]|uniref:SusC/RagA family TonB-linked outer membrane protein n=1 Tax=Salegentibacter salinarum TaxID=447422 RepID=A0A2N0TXK7_9FLAO|nr:SusC/RagA family TonB-linked outer membrane protein [Salegentibacter salinarum]PKD19477.1 SusC/RagA family TonB-linked outer membrane protein [Salegentibacter salinarum]SKB91729.1 TonB-linked outer membrane protein, SusC/RagA family [Salegentibacter salinarum]